MKMIDQTTKLTAKQQLFVEEYLIDLNATQAAIRAGYSKHTAQQMGSENLLKPVISGAIDKAIKERSMRLQITQEMVITGLLAEARLKDETASHSARVSAWAHLGKHLGMFIDRSEQNLNAKVTKADIVFNIKSVAPKKRDEDDG
jgi:phage terminase small subunit